MNVFQHFFITGHLILLSVLDAKQCGTASVYEGGRCLLLCRALGVLVEFLKLEAVVVN